MSRDIADSSADENRLHFFLMIAVMLLAAGLRLGGTLQAHLWLDEFWTLELAAGHDTAHEHLPPNVIISQPPLVTSLSGARPWWSVWTTLDQVTHPPLFYLLARAWRAALGESEMAVRLLPCAASIVSVLLIYQLARLLHGFWPAFWAALLMALGPQQIYFAQELRPYSLLVALGLAACLALVSIEKKALPGAAGSTFLRDSGAASHALFLHRSDPGAGGLRAYAVTAQNAFAGGRRIPVGRNAFQHDLGTLSPTPARGDVAAGRRAVFSFGSRPGPRLSRDCTTCNDSRAGTVCQHALGTSAGVGHCRRIGFTSSAAVLATKSRTAFALVSVVCRNPPSAGGGRPDHPFPQPGHSAIHRFI